MHVLMVRVEGKGLIIRQVDTLAECDRLPELIELNAEHQHMRMLIKLLTTRRKNECDHPHCKNKNKQT
jgi:hypothetical protein